MKFKIILLNILIIYSMSAVSQSTSTVSGIVYEVKNGKKLPLIGANVYWQGTSVGTASSTKGKFELERVKGTNILVVSFIGYTSDTVSTVNTNYLELELVESLSLEEVSIERRVKSTSISTLTPRKVEHISEIELQKAACCNLSESFETNPSVDVSFTDAVTGTRQIQMLGLAGTYTQFTRENIPFIRGLSSVNGLTFVPGTWVESIQLNKGTGSVVNGYESITGQINVELRKPDESERFYLNLFGNSAGRAESNIHLAKKINSKWSSGLLLHGMNNSQQHDKNKDGFLDMPIGNTFIAFNRWRYMGELLRFQAGVKGVYLDKTGGQLNSYLQESSGRYLKWTMNQSIREVSGWAKMGKLFAGSTGRSMALQVSGDYYTSESNFGERLYNGKQSSIYANYIYQDIIGNTNHKFTTGTSFSFDKFNEFFIDTTFSYSNVVPGLYYEYTYNNLERFSIVSGIRADYSSIYGIFATPRVHLRYVLFKNTVFRASAGRGLRTANVISENSGWLASSRNFIIQGTNAATPYGLDAEIAWNLGLNLTKKFTLDYREGSVSADFYRTEFQNQIVVDVDSQKEAIIFYNLKGESFSNSFQIQADYELLKRFDVRLAFRWYDVKTTYGTELLTKPLIASERAFINGAYHGRKHWKFDATLNWQGKKRIPGSSSPSNDFLILNAQISKSFKERLDIYLGGENLLNFKQKNPIVSSEDPFNSNFDSSLIWGPIFGREFYGGVRFKIQ